MFARQTRSASRSRRSDSLKARLLGTLRVTIYLGIVSLVLLYWSVRSAYAEGERAMRRLGEQLLAELGPAIVGPPQALQINGQTLFLGVTQSPYSVRETLDQFEESCASKADPREQFPMIPGWDPTPDELRKMPSDLQKVLNQDPTRFGTIRHESEEQGQISCLAQPKHHRGFMAVMEAAKEFLESGDLSRLGDMRYATARKLDNGETQVIAIWSEGKFPIYSLFPEEGDAPGSDMPNVPRPPGGTRRFSAAAEGQSFGMRIYSSERPPQEVLDFYEGELPKGGWSSAPTGLDGGVLREGAFVRSFLRNERLIAIGVESKQPGHSEVLLLDFGTVQQSRGFATASPLD